MDRPLTFFLAALSMSIATATPAAEMRAPGDWVPGATITADVIQVIDGDTLRVRGRSGQADVRLHGIDAPEWDQTCLDASRQSMACGAMATQVVMDILHASETDCPSNRMHGACVGASLAVTCTVTAIDRRYGRPVAICSAAGVDIGRELVAQGYARAAYSKDYVLVSSQARFLRRGLWAGEFVDPAIQRHGTSHPQRSR